jgi:hypothetical protein
VKATVSPLLIGPANCEAACGMPWRHVRDHARALGIEPVRLGRKLAVPAEAFLLALATGRPREHAPSDPAGWCPMTAMSNGSAS